MSCHTRKLSHHGLFHGEFMSLCGIGHWSFEVKDVCEHGNLLLERPHSKGFQLTMTGVTGKILVCYRVLKKT